MGSEFRMLPVKKKARGAVLGRALKALTASWAATRTLPVLIAMSRVKADRFEA